METVVHRGRKIAYEYSDRGGGGENGGLLCIHGSGGSRDVWKSQRRLSDRWPVATVDLSGHGDSENIDASAGYVSLSAYADDVIAVAEETGSTVFVGNSLGGAVVQHLVLERAYDPDAIVLTGTGARLGVLEDLLSWLEDDFERAVEFLHGPNRLFHDPEPRLREASKRLLLESGRAVTQRDFLTCHEFDVREDVSAIDVPTLVVYGEHDQLTPPWFHEYLADEIPDATLVEIEDAAHLAMLEQPTAFNDAVASFLEDREL